MHNQFKTQKFKHLMLAMGPRDLNSAPYSPVHCSSHSMTSFQSSELTELPVVENSQLFAQRTVRPQRHTHTHKCATRVHLFVYPFVCCLHACVCVHAHFRACVCAHVYKQWTNGEICTNGKSRSGGKGRADTNTNTCPSFHLQRIFLPTQRAPPNALAAFNAAQLLSEAKLVEVMPAFRDNGPNAAVSRVRQRVQADGTIWSIVTCRGAMAVSWAIQLTSNC